MAEPPLRDPELMLSLAYVPAAVRPAVQALWRLDERLAAIVYAPNQPIAAIKLAWWREALERLDATPPPPEPLLREVAALLLPAGITGLSLGTIAGGWDALLDGDLAADGDAMLARHAEARGGGMFTAVAILLGGGPDDVKRHGVVWALAGLPPPFAKAARGLAQEQIGLIGMRRWPRPLRSLGLLSVLARDRLLRGDAQGGSPRRVARAMWLAISGW